VTGIAYADIPPIVVIGGPLVFGRVGTMFPLCQLGIVTPAGTKELGIIVGGETNCTEVPAGAQLGITVRGEANGAEVPAVGIAPNEEALAASPMVRLPVMKGFHPPGILGAALAPAGEATRTEDPERGTLGILVTASAGEALRTKDPEGRILGILVNPVRRLPPTPAGEGARTEDAEPGGVEARSLGSMSCAVMVAQ